MAGSSISVPSSARQAILGKPITRRARAASSHSPKPRQWNLPSTTSPAMRWLLGSLRPACWPRYRSRCRRASWRAFRWDVSQRPRKSPRRFSSWRPTATTSRASRSTSTAASTCRRGRACSGVSARREPADDRRRHLALRTCADIHADVTEFEFERRVVLAPDQPLKRFGSVPRHQVIFTADQIQQRQLQTSQIHPAAGDFKLVPREAVLLIKPGHELLKSGSGLVGTVEYPPLDSHEVVDLRLIRASEQQVHVFLVAQAERHQRQEQLIQSISRYIAISHPGGHIDFSRPLREQVRGRVEINR